MAAPDAASSTDDIELHFCQACGISIPQADIDTGRAHPVEGACAYLSQPDRCPIKFAERRVEVHTPSRDPGARLLAAVAILYVVAATTFLLFRELNRQPPVLDLSDLASSAQLQQLSRKLDAVDDQSRRALADLKSNDARQVTAIEAMGERVGRAHEDIRKVARAQSDGTRQLENAVLEIAKRTLGIKGGMESVLDELRGMRDRPGATGPEPSRPEPTVRDTPQPPKQPERSKEELERDRLMGEYIAKLKDRKASDQTRYNAAVQLGDLKHPDAVDALVEALAKDPNDLVRRAAAWSLGMLGRHAVRAIPALIEQIGGKQEYVGYMCERALGEITKAVLGEAQTFDFDPTMSLRQRKQVQRRWQDWWEANRARLLPGGGA